MSMSFFQVPTPINEPIKSYAPNSVEKKLLKAELERQKKANIEVPIYIGNEKIKTNKTAEIKAPHDHALLIGKFHKASADHAKMAITKALQAREKWSETSWEDRAAIFLKAADMLAQSPWRERMNAATMLGQSKNPFQAEIDAACELIDFWKFNVHYMTQIYKDQPYSPNLNWNKVEYRPLEGFVFAVTPFNFTSIAANLPTAPALMGNVVVWKPASTSMLSSYYIMELLKEAGLPDGVINMIPGSGEEIGSVIFSHPEFSGLHFTGSTNTFRQMWKTIGENLGNNIYKHYPRIVGETGGKDFIITHNDVDPKAVAVAMVRGAFEFQGQKCSAASRAYIPRSIWNEVKTHAINMTKEMTVGDICDFRTFIGAVIDKKSFDNIKSYVDHAKNSNDMQIIVGGKCDDSKGYFIYPTIVETKNPKCKLMEEEIFGPVLTVYVYEDNKLDETLKLVDETSPYALTGAIFAKDRYVIEKMSKALRNAAGNFYINDKPTGAVVGQQPFGGARASGTNDKAGSYLNLLRFVSMRTIKENFVPPTEYGYPHLKEE